MHFCANLSLVCNIIVTIGYNIDTLFFLLTLFDESGSAASHLPNIKEIFHDLFGSDKDDNEDEDEGIRWNQIESKHILVTT